MFPESRFTRLPHPVYELAHHTSTSERTLVRGSNIVSQGKMSSSSKSRENRQASQELDMASPPTGPPLTTTRSASFQPEREPFAQDDRFSPSAVRGPFHHLNPTRAEFAIEPRKFLSDEQSSSEDVPTDAIKNPPRYTRLWRSRDNRKGRHPLLVSENEVGRAGTPQPTSKPTEVLKTIGKMFTYYPVWDISWLVAYIFTWGSVVWCINGFFSFLPYIRPDLDFPGESLYAGGISAFIGAVLFFEFGSILLMFEAVNENRAGCFGWAVEKLIDDEETGETRVQLSADRDNCGHHHQNKKNFVGSAKNTSETKDNGKTWQWFPTWQALKTHYFHELGFIASFSQFCGATIFSIAGITALPGIINNMSQGLTDGIYWAPQIVGGSGFIISGTLYMLETQKNWYTPSFNVLGWHIAFWNLIGGIGFTLCGALGPAAGNNGAQYQAACATFWGSFAFLIGSLLQLYESLQKNPVEVKKDN